jgi:NAD(P)-dependent dehydrogenase (short-subunit alcohol dehydrogenase family)
MSTPFGLEGKVAVITGGAVRLGFELATHLAQSSMKVAIVDINQENGETAEKQLQAKDLNVKFFKADITKQPNIETAMSEIAKHFGRIDLLINNAKAGNRTDLQNTQTSDWSTCIDVGLIGAFNCARAAAPFMEQINSGSIINISSVAATNVCAESPQYHVSKAGLDQLTRYLAVNLGPKGIRVNAIAPGLIIKDDGRKRYESDVKFKARWEFCHPLKKAGNSLDVAGAIMFLASKYSSFITGQIINVDGGLTINDPGWLLNSYLFNHQENP